MTEPKSGPEIPGEPETSMEIPGDSGESKEISGKAYRICGAQRSQGGGAPCTRPAGWGTTHPGEGSCKLHGGATPIKSGRYSVITRERVRELIAQFEEDENPLDMAPELNACRALYVDFIERYDEFTDAIIAWHASYDGDRPSAKPRQILDIADAHRLLAEITRMVKRIEDVKAGSAISRADFYRVMTEMGRAVDLAVEDPDVREKIHDAWMEIRLG